MLHNLQGFFFRQIREAQQEADRIYEPMIGIVTDNKDPDKLMRVKVKFPALSEQDTTWWISVISYGAGKDRGWFFLPEVNDEVLVGFEHGDINRPVVIGALWNGSDAPPEEQSSGNPKRVLVSRSGSRIEFDDDANTIVIKDGGGKGEITFKADDNKLIIEAKSGDVVFTAPSDEMQIKATDAIEMKADMNMDIRAKSEAKLTGKGGAKLEASMPLIVYAAATDLQPGGTGAAAEASTSPEEIPDPLGT
jgi:uncharacterized protein involved in type VI secretion and phage assembly